jgi:hypothetical protein
MPEGDGVSITTQADGVKAREQAPAPGLIDELTGMFASVRAALSDFLDLLTLEARSAGLALMWMLVCGIIAAACIISAWLGLMAALVIGVVSLGYSPLLAVIAIALINGAAGALLIYRGISVSHDLRFSATRRQLSGKPHVLPVAP